MKKILTLIPAVLMCVLMAVCMSVGVSADEPADSTDKIGTMTVVYLRDGGKGDGHDYANAVGTLEDAYMMLDLSKDCHIVVCDVFTQINANFTIGDEYEGCVTITSCYGGYDYRTIGAKFEFDPFRFICWGETRFEYIEFHTPGTNLLLVGQHNPVTIGEGVKISGDQMTGGNVAKSFCILGGYQKQRNESDPVVPPMEDNRDTNITVMSGEFIYIVPFSRQLNGNSYEGTAHIKIGGNAKVSVLHGSAIGTGTYVGNIEVEITDNALVKNFYGATEAGINAKSHTFNWKSGTIEKFEWLCSYSSNPELIVSGNRTLNASAAVKAMANYNNIAALFDVIGNEDNASAYIPAQNPNTAKPGDDILKAPVTTKTPLPPVSAEPEQTTPVDTDKSPETTAKPVTEKETKPAFTRAPRDEQTTDVADTSPSDSTNGTLVVIIAAVVAVAVIAVVIVIVVSKKKKA